jgi:hypothetical protein
MSEALGALVWVLVIGGGFSLGWMVADILGRLFGERS